MLIDAFGNLKVSDFGFARIVERDQKVIRQVYVGMGTVAYMAPELFTDAQAAGPQTDIYASGIIFYEMLTRKLPGRRSPMPSEIDPKLPKQLDDIFDLMTRDSQSERYASVDDILADFESIDGLGELMGTKGQGLAVENPLTEIVFREPELQEEDVEEVAEEAVSEETSEHDEVVSSIDKASSKHRPYSFQQRNKK